MQIQRTDGLWYWAEYSTFSISDEADKYRLTVDGYSGDAGDALLAPKWPNWIANGMMFTTLDSDNDINPYVNCGEKIKGGWWYRKCGTGIVNRNNNGIWVTGDAMYDVGYSIVACW